MSKTFLHVKQDWKLTDRSRVAALARRTPTYNTSSKWPGGPNTLPSVPRKLQRSASCSWACNGTCPLQKHSSRVVGVRQLVADSEFARRLPVLQSFRRLHSSYAMWRLGCTTAARVTQITVIWAWKDFNTSCNKLSFFATAPIKQPRNNARAAAATS